MYKPGDIHNRLGIDPKTLLTWIDRFPEFFSEGAKGAPGTLSRMYTDDDLLVVNTILKLRAGKQEFEKIRAQLQGGFRDKELPISFYEMDGEKAVTVFGDLKQLEVRYEDAQAEIERLRKELDMVRDTKMQEIIELNRKIAVLEFQLQQKSSRGAGE